MRTLVLGGIRSGKSRWAEAAISATLGADQPVRYLATGLTAGPEKGDTAWALRVAEHRARRPGHWPTLETTDITAALRHSPQLPTVVDDVGGWLTAMLDRHGWTTVDADARDGLDTTVATEIDALLAAVTDFSAALMLVSPEVGLSVIPATASGRRFADQLGSLNQRLADCCDRVVLVVAGQAVRIKPPNGPVGI